MLATRGLLSRAEAGAILRALDDIERGTDVAGARLHRRARGLLLPRPDRARAAPRGRDGREAPHRPEPERHRPHGVQDGAQGARGRAPGRPAGRHRRGARGGGGQPGHAGGGVHPRPAGAADHLRPLPRRARRAPAPGRGAAPPGEPVPRHVEHGRRGDHDLRLPAGPGGDGGPPRLRRGAGELLRLHRRRRLPDQRVRRAPAPLHPPRPVHPGPQRLDRAGGGAPPRSRRVRAGELDHAAEAESGRRWSTSGSSARSPRAAPRRRSPCSTTRRSPT